MSAASRVTPVTDDAQRVRRGYRVGEAAWLLGLTYDVTLALVNAGQIGSRQVGKYHIVPALEIERFLAPAVRAA